MLGDHENARRVAIEAMHEAWAFAAEAVGHRCEHAVDMAFCAGAALDGDAERLVEYEHVFVFVNDAAFDQVAIGIRDMRFRAGRF